MDWTPLRAQLNAAGTLTLKVKVIPKSSRTEAVDQLADSTLKIKLAAVPEKGKANAELIAYLSEVFSLPRANITLLTGATSPTKRLRLQKP